MPSQGQNREKVIPNQSAQRIAGALGFWKVGGDEQPKSLIKLVDALAPFGCRRYFKESRFY